MAQTRAPTSKANGFGVLTLESQNARASERDVAMPEGDDLSAELERLVAANADLVNNLRGGRSTTTSDDHVVEEETDTADLLRENAELRIRIVELEALLAQQDGNELWAQQQQEYEALLDEKSEVIRSLHLKMQELQESARRDPDAPIPKEEELLLLKEDLEEQRRQLRADEESLMAQMRQMELAMSKDRAELARQRQEMQRLQADLNREVEQNSRDPELRERLNSLRRGQEAPKKEVPKKEAPAPAPAAEPAKQSSGILRRLFG